MYAITLHFIKIYPFVQKYWTKCYFETSIKVNKCSYLRMLPICNPLKHEYQHQRPCKVPRRYFFCGSFVLFMSCLSCLLIAALWSPSGKMLTSWLLFVMFNCVLSLSNVVSWVRCGTWLYRFLIFGAFLTLKEIGRKMLKIERGNDFKQSI